MANNQNNKNNIRNGYTRTNTKTIKPAVKTNNQTNQHTITNTNKIGQEPPQNTQSTPANKNQTASYNKSNSNEPKMKRWVVALIIIGTTLLVGGIGTLLGGRMQEGYIKPPCFAPDWLFPIVWSINYVGIGIATYLTYTHNKDKDKRRNDLIWYGIHLFFNMLWPLFFFRLNLLIFSVIWLIFNVVSAIIVTYRYYRSNLTSGIIFTIYTLWLLYALYLNLGITLLNFPTAAA